MSETKKEDLGEVAFGGVTEDGQRIAYRRQNGTVTPVAFNPVQDGKPIPPGVEVLHLDPKCDDGWHKVTSSFRTGPAQVATPAYREGYDRIFGKKREVGLA